MMDNLTQLQPTPVSGTTGGTPQPEAAGSWSHSGVRSNFELGVVHGIGRVFLTDGSRLRIATSGCALVLRDGYAPHPYAAAVLAHVAGFPPRAGRSG
ncbi:hypothetical protein [Streptomyces noursei]|uniref:hypothetical protein n=1 Tax=Streptomyces noursei TaxID=1971 RepID=UPI0030F0E388